MSKKSPKPTKSQSRGLAEQLRLAEVSGKWAVGWLLLCMTITGLLIPLVFKMPLWVELEIVIAAWWMVWGVTLTSLLYKAHRLSDDYDPKPGPPDPDGCDTSGDGLVDLLLTILFSMIVVVGTWLLVELVIPFVFFMMYFLIRGMLAHVVHDRPQCHGNFWLASGRGLFWATCYTVPLAATIWMIHLAQTRHP